MKSRSNDRCHPLQYKCLSTILFYAYDKTGKLKEPDKYIEGLAKTSLGYNSKRLNSGRLLLCFACSVIAEVSVHDIKEFWFRLVAGNFAISSKRSSIPASFTSKEDLPNQKIQTYF